MLNCKSLFTLLAIAAVVASAASAEVVTDNLVYRWDAATSASTDTAWASVAPASNTTATWAVSDVMSLNPAVVSATPIHQAWTWDASLWDGAPYANDLSQPSVTHFGALAPDASFELWIKPANLSGNEVIFETGGRQRGMAILLSGNEVVVIAKQAAAQDDAEVVLTHTLSAADINDFIQIVVTTTTASHKLYVNTATETNPAALRAGSTISYGDFAGTDAASLGGSIQIGGSDGDDGGATVDDESQYYAEAGAYTGQIAIINFYNDVLTGAEVAQNFNAVVPEPTSAMLVLGGALSICAGGRRR